MSHLFIYWHGWILNALYEVKEAISKRLHGVWFHSHDILGKAKLRNKNRLVIARDWWLGEWLTTKGLTEELFRWRKYFGVIDTWLYALSKLIEWYIRKRELSRVQTKKKEGTYHLRNTFWLKITRYKQKEQYINTVL